MPAKWRGTMMLAAGSVIAAVSMTLPAAAYASTATTKHHISHSGHTAVAEHIVGQSGSKHGFGKHALSKSGKARYARAGGGISCVPFARAATGIALKGNAANWWDAAAGVYERGSRPETGSVLNFRATGQMRLGHVAVVTNVIGDREIEIDHANWWGPGAGKGGVSRGIRVEDVSENNDWSAVRVALGHSGEYGSVYPTYGFIYDRPDSGTMIANAKPAPNPATDRAMLDEVAEAPMPKVIYPASLPVDAPDRGIR
jgi:surface antigen